MSEDAPLEPVAPEPASEPAGAEPTQPVPTAPSATAPAGGAPGTPTWPNAAVAPPPPPPPRSSTVAVPKWLLIVVGALVVALFGFIIGWIAAPGDSTRTVRMPGRGFFNGPNAPNNGGEFFGGGGTGNGDGAAPATPTIPAPGNQQQGGAFLGVATASSTNPSDAKIVRVVAGTPAADAGLKVGDVITKVDDATVSGPQQLATRISDHQSGDHVTITYVRAGKTDTASVTLTDRSSVELPTPSTTAPRL